MRAHDRTNTQGSTVSNELFWAAVAVVLVVCCAALGWFGVMYA